MVTCWKRANLLALLYVMFSCVFITFPCGVLGQVWSLIVSIPDVSLLPYFHIEGKYVFITLKTRNYKTGSIASSEDPDEMPRDAAFH